MSTSSNSEKPSSSRGKNTLRNLALSALVFVLCISLAEVVFRFMGYGNVEIYEPDPLVYWRLKPNQRCFTKVGHKPVRVNAHGTRGPDFEAAKPANTIRVVSLGDSRTFGWGLSDEETYSAVLESLLRKEGAPARRVEVINCGVNAWSFAQMTAFFRERALKWQPDVVVLGEANFWTQFSENNDPVFVKQFMSRVRLKNLLRRFALYHYVIEVQLEKYYERYRVRFIPVDPKNDELMKEQQKKDPDALFREALDQICAVAGSNGVKVVLLSVPFQEALLGTNDFGAGMLHAKQTVSRKYGVPLLDLRDHLRPRATELYLEADPVHLNAAGNEIIGRRLAEVVSPLIRP